MTLRPDAVTTDAAPPTRCPGVRSSEVVTRTCGRLVRPHCLISRSEPSGNTVKMKPDTGRRNLSRRRLLLLCVYTSVRLAIFFVVVVVVLTPDSSEYIGICAAMAGLIKKQILKHLSRFAKNLSPDKINLSTLKGEGQLTNLELDEEVLQSLLDLPTWLAINRVCCNKAAIRIPWTKLKTHPISLTLDKVEMEMSTCDEPRPPNGPSPIATASGQSEYGFAEKVVEGMSLSINSIVIRISAKAFNASFELSQLQVYSVNTSWSISDLRFTRIQDPQRGEILTFKEISWQMIRIEADAIQSAEHEMLSAPIRLITNQSKIRVTLKRRIKDCNVVASKLILILDDLLWVLTDSQLKAMVQYAKSLSEAMEKSAQQRKSMATEDQVSSAPPSAQQVRTQQASTAADQSANHGQAVQRLRLINKRITGGAMQLSFSTITLDYYPFHRAGDSCAHWMHYSEATKTREGWARNLLDEFKS
ncbi:UHRF1-binding protein 1-like [Larimichthys crocea]|uniref:Uncharacterized protein n=1 Tax=Larimichthys crocea TaxID=215358 RepID=A0ACD3Q5Z1_LARCR|nr:UHRF1-binding protein 1-like [Larimichthys crocea]